MTTYTVPKPAHGARSGAPEGCAPNSEPPRVPSPIADSLTSARTASADVLGTRVLAARKPPGPTVEEREPVKQAEEESFVDLIACERDCRTCSYAAALDCDGNCGVCPHNSYCPCVNPVVARSKTALRLIELRPILLQDLRVKA